MSNAAQGYMLAGLAVLFWGLWGFFSKLATHYNNPFMVGFMSNLFFGLMAPLLFWLGRSATPALDLSAKALLPAFGNGVVAFVGGAVYLFAVSKAPATVVVPVTAAYPIVTTLLAVMFLKETVDYKQVLGMMMVIGGCILVGLGGHK